MASAFIAVGSNIEPAENVARALRLLAGSVGIRRLSNVYSNPAEPRPEQPPYYNCVVMTETAMTPLDIKATVLRRIEDALGRVRAADKYADRTIDLDLIAYDDWVVATDHYTLPDPKIGERAFLAIPLSEVAPDWMVPGSGVSIAAIAASVANRQLEFLEAYTLKLREELGC